MYDFIKLQYDFGYFTAEDVNSFVPFWISADEAKEILKEG